MEKGERGIGFEPDGDHTSVLAPAPLIGDALAAAIVRSTDDAIVAEAFDGTILSWNPGAEALYGYRADEVVGANVSVLSPPDMADDLAAELTKIARGARVKTFETVRQCKDGTLVEVSMNVSAVRDASGDAVCTVAVSRHALAGPRMDSGMVHQALHDSLTGLPSRALGEDRLAACMRGLVRRSGMIAVLFVDLDHFKDVNDRHGHAAGDQVLRAAASRLESVLRPADTVYRYGGDEFIIVCPEIRDAGQALTVAGRAAQALRFSYHLDSGDVVSMTASIGVAMGQPDDLPGALIRNADRAMYKAKAAGRARVEMFRASSPVVIDLAESRR